MRPAERRAVGVAAEPSARVRAARAGPARRVSACRLTPVRPPADIGDIVDPRGSRPAHGSGVRDVWVRRGCVRVQCRPERFVWPGRAVVIILFLTKAGRAAVRGGVETGSGLCTLVISLDSASACCRAGEILAVGPLAAGRAAPPRRGPPARVGGRVAGREEEDVRGPRASRTIVSFCVVRPPGGPGGPGAGS